MKVTWPQISAEYAESLFGTFSRAYRIIDSQKEKENALTEEAEKTAASRKSPTLLSVLYSIAYLVLMVATIVVFVLAVMDKSSPLFIAMLLIVLLLLALFFIKEVITVTRLHAEIKRKEPVKPRDLGVYDTLRFKVYSASRILSVTKHAWIVYEMVKKNKDNPNRLYVGFDGSNKTKESNGCYGYIHFNKRDYGDKKNHDPSWAASSDSTFSASKALYRHEKGDREIVPYIPGLRNKQVRIKDKWVYDRVCKEDHVDFTELDRAFLEAIEEVQKYVDEIALMYKDLIEQYEIKAVVSIPEKLPKHLIPAEELMCYADTRNK